MPYRIIRDDISRVSADAIVCSASPEPGVIGGGEAAIHEAAGSGLMRARYRFGRLEPGAAVVTKAYGLHARYVIHAVGPVWRDGHSGEIETLHRCYRNAICTAISMGCKSAAFPLISSGRYGFAKAEAMRAAIWEFQCFADEDIELILVVYDREAYELSAQRFSDVAAYIDQNYVDAHPPREGDEADYRLGARLLQRGMPPLVARSLKAAPAPKPGRFGLFPRRVKAPDEEDAGREAAKREPDGAVFSAVPRSAYPGAPAPGVEEAPAAPTEKFLEEEHAAPDASLEERMRALDAGFSETLLKLIDESGCTDAEIYKRANVSRKLFSKIRSSADYRPSKPTALAFCVALHMTPAAARELLARAGFALSRSSRADVIVEYYLEKGIYDIIEINEALFCFDQPLLGSA